MLPKLLYWSPALLCLSLAFASGGAAQSLEEFDSDYLESPPGGPNFSEAVQLILDRTNQLRREEGLEPVTVEERLRKTTRYFAAYMAGSGEYGHQADGNKPSERASLFDYEYCLVSENIAKQFDSSGVSTRELGVRFYEGWRDSPGHRENMVNPYVTETAVSIALDPESETYYAVQMFGRPKSSAIRFQVVNRSGGSISYKVVAQGAGDGAGKEFSLPRLAARTHLRCRPTLLDWGWTDEAEQLRVESGATLTIEGDQGELQVDQGTMEQASASPNENGEN